MTFTGRDRFHAIWVTCFGHIGNTLQVGARHIYNLLNNAVHLSRNGSCYNIHMPRQFFGFCSHRKWFFAIFAKTEGPRPKSCITSINKLDSCGSFEPKYKTLRHSQANIYFMPFDAICVPFFGTLAILYRLAPGTFRISLIMRFI